MNKTNDQGRSTQRQKSIEQHKTNAVDQNNIELPMVAIDNTNTHEKHWNSYNSMSIRKRKNKGRENIKDSYNNNNVINTEHINDINQLRKTNRLQSL